MTTLRTRLAKNECFMKDTSFTPFFRRPRFQTRKKPNDSFVCIGLGKQRAKAAYGRARLRNEKIVERKLTWYDGRHHGGNYVSNVGPQLGICSFQGSNLHV